MPIVGYLFIVLKTFLKMNFNQIVLEKTVLYRYSNNEIYILYI